MERYFSSDLKEGKNDEGSEQEHTVTVWDTAGQEEFDHIRRLTGGKYQDCSHLSPHV